MRFIPRLAALLLPALLLPACASVAPSPSPLATELAATSGATPGLIAAAQAVQEQSLHTAQLADIRNAEARLDLARSRLDFNAVRNRGAEDGDVREFLDARRSLRLLRNVYGPTDTGYRDIFSAPVWPVWRRGHGGGFPGIGFSGGWQDGAQPPLGLSGRAGGHSAPLSPGAAQPLSGLRR
ncbi:MAG: hypothetical protein AAF311_07965 [Pseudomonadota bacterium]